MTVRELITKLLEYNPEVPVYFRYELCCQGKLENDNVYLVENDIRSKERFIILIDCDRI